MKVRRPDYFKDFCCTGSDCSDNCCIGWEIDIDMETMERYRKAEGMFGRRLHNSISSDDEPHFILKNERCPFLNKENLCDIIVTMGNDSICEICREHPRYYEWFGYLKEAGLGLCCEEAARLMLQNRTPLAFEETEESEEEGDEELLDEPELLEALYEARENVFWILQDRSRNLWERFEIVLSLATELQVILDENDSGEKTEKMIRMVSASFRNTEHRRSWFGKSDLPFQEGKGNQKEQRVRGIRTLLKFYEGMEAIDENWTKRLRDLENRLPALLDQEFSFRKYYEDFLYEYEHLAVYFIYRYFLKSYYDRDVISKAGMAAVSCLVIWITGIYTWMETGEFSLKEQIRVVKDYSREVEYSTENMERLEEAFWTDESFRDAFFKIIAPL
ncbi:flagellin lysine-N-methylase [Clostridium sp. AM58-1XD]|uniref:flagellin lysine-N-methylase n=1 Tax=Clostridium sp. AM58-1XD TaxID=2292307 RepID=UPI000E4B4151|nr:flagellin lysine-N-methylase [Clostridium sp. AM58-1XD]RGZ00129.1 hypothetical protein DXA13_05810 [Clostridium sp. AM58-1XD]